MAGVDAATEWPIVVVMPSPATGSASIIDCDLTGSLRELYSALDDADLFVGIADDAPDNASIVLKPIA